MTDATIRPSGPLASFWTDLVADAEAIEAEYREDGWEVLSVEPGDVSPVDKEERFGLSVLLPGSEYEAVEEVVEREGISFDEAEVYRRTVGEIVFVLVVERDPTSEVAVVVPLYYSPQWPGEIVETAVEEGVLEIHLRPLSVENWVTFSHDDPSLFVPEDDEGIDVGDDEISDVEEPDTGEPSPTDAESTDDE